MKTYHVCTLFLCLLLNGCGGCCPDKPEPLVKFELSPISDTVTVGDTVCITDRSYCYHVLYHVYTFPSGTYTRYMRFPKDSLNGTFREIINYNNYIECYYSDSLRGDFNYDTTKRLQAKFVMNGDTGTYIISARGISTYTACVNGWPTAHNVPVESTLYDTIYVKHK